jgi:hypothetical protein
MANGHGIKQIREICGAHDVVVDILKKKTVAT